MSDSSSLTEEATLAIPSPPTRKRKRDSTVTEIEVNINAPEPPSKKALRKAKKGQTISTTSTTSKALEAVDQTSTPEGNELAEKPSSAKRSNYGIWIGNLPWSATKTNVRSFFTANTDITDDQITRLHMPTPREITQNPARPNTLKPQNKGFAYVDFSTFAALEQALALTETLFTGRRVLIKDAKSFQGRPDKPALEAGEAPTPSGKPASKRIFVGNLEFDITDEDLREHFSRCGEVTNVHVATFEDSGKCKGFAWVEFEELAAGQAAVKGWVELKEESEEEEDNADNGSDVVALNGLTNPTSPKTRKKLKPRKWWINRLKGRPLKLEFAEDATLRYKKRFGKGGTAHKDLPLDEAALASADPDADTVNTTPPRPQQTQPSSARFRRKPDARTIKPGAALAAAPRLTGGIVVSRGTKTTFG